MLSLLHSYLTKVKFDTAVKARKQNKPSFVHRDDFDKLKRRAKGEAKPLFPRDQEDGSENLRKRIHGRVEEEKGRIRVKLLLTEEEAMRLMSKCKEGVLEFKDVAGEVSRIPASRVTVVSSSYPTNGMDSHSPLESILEEP